MSRLLVALSWVVVEESGERLKSSCEHEVNPTPFSRFRVSISQAREVLRREPFHFLL